MPNGHFFKNTKLENSRASTKIIYGRIILSDPSHIILTVHAKGGEYKM